MKYFAEIKNGVVVNLIQSEDSDVSYLPGKYVEYSEDGSFRYNPATIGSYYDEEKDAFIALKIHESWTLNEDTLRWEAPIAKPDGPAAWDEENQVWNTPDQV
jgi:hypothetical protein